MVCCCDSARRAMDHRRAADEERIMWLETVLKETSEAATESERKYEEVCFNGHFQICMVCHCRHRFHVNCETYMYAVYELHPTVCS